MSSSSSFYEHWFSFSRKYSSIKYCNINNINVFFIAGWCCLNMTRVFVRSQYIQSTCMQVHMTTTPHTLPENRRYQLARGLHPAHAASCVNPLYWESSKGGIILPTLSLSLSFPFHIPHPLLNSISPHLFSLPVCTIVDRSVIWTKSGDQSYNWMFGRVAIITTDTNPSVYLEGKAGNGYQGDIAIDDIAFNYGDCPALCECNNKIIIAQGDAYTIQTS